MATLSPSTTRPGTPSLALARDTGTSGTDRLTRDATLAVAPAAAGDQILYAVDGAAFTTDLPRIAADGLHTVAVKARDAGGQDSDAATLTFTLDTHAPAISVGTATPSSDATLTLNGTVGLEDAGAAVRVLEGTTLVATATVGVDGHWSVPVTVSGNGAHALVVEVADRAGNVGQGSVTVQIDTVSGAPSPGVAEPPATPGNAAVPAAPGVAPAAASHPVAAPHPISAAETLPFAFAGSVVGADAHGVYVRGPAGNLYDVTGVQKLVFADGIIDRADGNRLVDDLFYYAKNPDVWAAHLDAEAHYAQNGRAEGRAPNAFFDAAGYLAHNPDVAAAGLDPLAHYDSHGWREGRDPGPAFSTRGYLAANPDVAAAGLDPLAHYLAYGQGEGRHGWEIAA